METDAKIGHITVGLTSQARSQFKNAIDELSDAIEMYQSPRLPAGPGKGKTKGAMLKLMCPECGRVIRASKKTLDVGPITCAPCTADFTIESD